MSIGLYGGEGGKCLFNTRQSLSGTMVYRRPLVESGILQADCPYHEEVAKQFVGLQTCFFLSE